MIALMWIAVAALLLVLWLSYRETYNRKGKI
jgi:hypothetical protein